MTAATAPEPLGAGATFTSTGSGIPMADWRKLAKALALADGRHRHQGDERC